MKHQTQIDALVDHIARKSEAGIPYTDAVQLIALLYVTLDILPQQFRCVELSRESLAKLFSMLTLRGTVISAEGKSGFHPVLNDAACPEHWERLLAGIATGSTKVNPAFLERANDYV